MYGDTQAIRRLAQEFREQAVGVRTLSTELLWTTHEAAWSGLGAEAMRSSAVDRCARMRRTAVLHDDAAQALEHHADEVDRLKAEIARLERLFRAVVADAADRLVPDSFDELMDRLVAPPSGDRSWLDFDFPGA